MKIQKRVLQFCFVLMVITGIMALGRSTDTFAASNITISPTSSTVSMTYGGSSITTTVNFSGDGIHTASYGKGTNGDSIFSVTNWSVDWSGGTITYTLSPLSAGTTTLNTYLKDDDGNTIGSTSITVVVQKATMNMSSSSYTGTYDGSSHTISISVSAPSSYTIYYSTSTSLTASNYASAGSTTKPTRTAAGRTTVYYYIKDNTGNYNDVSDYWWIFIKPNVTATAYSGTYNGSAHSPTVTATGGATLYYSASTELTYSNYSSSGSTTMPGKTAAGTYTVYYIAVPTSGAAQSACTTGSTTITINKASMTVTSSSYTGTYDGSAHTIPLTVSGPSSYTVYYSTSTSLTSSNYSSSGSTTKPTRTSSGRTTVYFYIKDNTGNYNDFNDYWFINVKPKVTATAYTGTYNGTAYSPTISVTGSATLYYSTSTALTYNNYSSSGSTTLPSSSSFGTTTVYYIAVPNSDAINSSCFTTGSTTITLKYSMTVTSSSYTCTYDGSAHTIPLTVSGPSSYTVYYSTSTSLTSSNYSSSGSTTKPSRTSAGTTEIWYYVKDNTGNYNDAHDYWWVYIRPKVTATAYSGTYDGSSHKATVTATGGATLYYSTSTALTYSNYSSSGSTTVPTRTAAGTTTVYYIAVPASNPSDNSCTTGSTTITINKADMTLSGSDVFTTYNGSAHTFYFNVSGPSSYTVYYSTTTALTSSNYSTSGTTTKPTRTDSGRSTCYFYVKDNTGNYNDKAYPYQLCIYIKPKVTVTAYTGTCDGSAHSPTISVTGNATLYYSTGTELTYSNYSTSGSTTLPQVSAFGTTTVYYIAIPDSDAYNSSYCYTKGSTTVSLKNNMTVSSGNYTGTYDGSAHTIPLTVSGPSSYTVYYSTSTSLNSSNYSSSGSTTKPSRTQAGRTFIYFYIKDNTGNYNDYSNWWVVFIKPAVTATAYSGTYDGSSHSAEVTAEGGATVYYSTSMELTSDNYSSYGSTTVPTRTAAGTSTVYYIAVPDSSDPVYGNCTTGSTTITIDKADMTIGGGSYTGTYDGASHTFTTSISGPSSYTEYYSTSDALTASNYSTGGTTTKPSRTNSGAVQVHVYVKDGTGNYNDKTYTRWIYIKPKVTVTAYTGTCDGSAHSPAISVTGNATLYYSTSTRLTYSNYSTSGSTTLPSGSEAGTTRVYYIAVPNSDAAETDYCYTTGSTTITLKNSMKVTASSYSGTYDGAAHSPTLYVSGPSSYTVYYSTSTELTATNYSSDGSTTMPRRSAVGATTVYYYVLDGTGEYQDRSGIVNIYIKPSVSASAYTGTYDGEEHSADVEASGADIYYSTSTPLLYNNYSSSGSATVPTRTTVGTTTVYYIAVPKSDPSSGVCTSGSTTITINRKNLADCTASLNTEKYTYTGDAITPAETVKDGSNTLENGTDYSITYANNTEIGTATVTITGKGNYTGTKTLNFTIVKEKSKANLVLESEKVTKTYGDDAFDSNLSTRDTDGSLSWSSDNNSVALVNSKGNVTIVGAGTATITVRSAETDDYEAGSASYKLTVNKKTAVLIFNKSSMTKTMGDGTFTNALATKETDGTVSYSSTNSAVARVDSETGKVTLVGAGTCYIVASATDGTNYADETASYKLTVNAAEEESKTKATLKFAESSVTKKYGSAAFTNTLTKVTDGKLTYKSGDTAVATVDSAGKVTIVGVGSTTITVSAAEGNSYLAGSASYTLTVSKAANKVTASNKSKVYAAKAQSFKLGATRLDGAKLSYKSSNAKIKVSTAGKVTVAAKYIGSATITITAAATEHYNKATKKIKVTVNPKAASITKAVSTKSGSITTYWSKVSPITKYQIQFSKLKSFAAGSTTSTIRDVASKYTNSSLTGFPAGTWYVRVRTYKTVSSKKYYSSWSAVKSVKVK